MPALLAATALRSAAQLSVGTSGLPVQVFDVAPPVSEWSTLSIGPNSPSAITTAAQVDAVVLTNSAASVNGVLTTESTSPIPGLFATARWNSTGRYLRTRASGNVYLLMKAALQNNSGGDLPAIFISYDLGALVAEDSSIVEEIPGHRVYYSLSGAPGSWISIPALHSPIPSAPGPKTAIVTFPTTWTNGTTLFVLFADDNGSAADTPPNREGAYTIDNFAVILPAPQIITQPQSQSVAPNASFAVTLAVDASGVPPLYYQWRKNSNDIAHATNQTYTIDNPLEVDSGFYSVVVSNSYGTVTSTDSFLEVACAASPSITAQPADRSIYSGELLVLSVSASGTPPYAYQWYQDGNVIPNATQQTYEVSNALPSHSGTYTVIVSNCAGSAASREAIVVVSDPPYLLFGLTNLVWRFDQSGLNLETAWKEVDYDDSGWSSGRGVLAREDNSNIRPLTNTVLSLTNASGSAVVTYYFRAHFTVTNRPLDVSLLLSNLIDDGAVFYINGNEFSRVQMPTVPVTSSTMAIGTSTESVFTNIIIPHDWIVEGDNVLAVEVHQVNTTSSDIVFGSALLAQNLPPGQPSIARQPADIAQFRGGDVVLSLALSRGSDAGYQWFHNGVALAGATSSILRLTNVSFQQSGAYFAVATNSFGSVTSRVAALNVLGGEASLRLIEFTNAWRFEHSGSNLGTAWRLPGYDDTTWPTGSGVFLNRLETGLPEPRGSRLSLTNASGNSITTYYFRVHFALPPGASNVVLVASNLLDDGAVFCLNGGEAARLRINGPVTATTLANVSPSPGAAYETLLFSSTNLVPGDNVLAVEVHQSPLLSSGVVFGMNLRAYGDFNQPVMILESPDSRAIEEGVPATFVAQVFGAPPVAIQWFHNNLLMPAETNRALHLPAVHAEQAGEYFFVASNFLSTATSGVANLSVLPDRIRPTLVAAFATNNPEGVVVVFSEPVAVQSATNPGSYALSPGASILGVQMLAPDRVLLIASGLDPLFGYTVTVSEVFDLADSPNAILPSSTTNVRPNRLTVATGLLQVQTVFVIVMENKSWSDLKDNTNAPYLNSLLPQASYCESYTSPGHLSPSQPNYLWMEAGQHFGHVDNEGPAIDRVASTNHLVTQLHHAGIEWRGYMESMRYGSNGIVSIFPYLARHNPFAYFDDVTADYDYCTNHVRPYQGFAGDLSAGTIGRYNFIVPNVTNAMHTLTPGGAGLIRQGDDWLSRELPRILSSPAYSNNGAVFITWDENGYADNYPIGMIVLSPLAKGNGYASRVPYDHGSTLRTMQEIFAVRPYLGQAAVASPLNDLFKDLSLDMLRTNGAFALRLAHMIPGRTNYVQSSDDLISWTTFSTNVATNTISIVDPGANGASRRFYRAVEQP